MNDTMEDKLLGSSEDDGKDLKLRIWVESKKFWTVACPAIITRLTSFGILVATQSFMGHIGPTELSSYALVQTFLLRFANGILLGMSSALETLCGQAYGAKQYHMMGIYMQRSWVVVLATATLMVPLFIFASPIFRLLGQEEELSVLSGKIALWCIPILYYFVFNFTIQMFLQSQLKNAINAWLNSMAFVLQLILSWLFVYKLNLGVPGAMAALVISSWSVGIGLLVYVIGGWCPDTWTGFSRSAFSDLYPVVKLSASSGVMLCLELWYNAVLILLAGHMKNATTSIAAFSICLNIVAWQLMLFFGFLTAACVRVSNELGRGDAEAAKFSVKVIMVTSLSLGVIFTILSLAFGHVISYAFTDSAEVAKAVSSLSFLLAISVFLNSIQPVLTGVAVGAGWQVAVAYVNIASYYALGIPVGVLLAYLFHLEIRGIWIGMVIGVGIQTLAIAFMTCRTDWDAQVDKASARLNRWFVPNLQAESNDITPLA
ncbi:hypothetical protein AQUCO_02100106v1 [Aquilegia coerulea]|uniref:Protein DETOXIFICATION n=1 Tax=Aquilegia coerulea TaxID=218851 RepID=A0A2G5DEY3_AQUCA|nr:hypothetical protein AQUCO_02100106v1 [Aquilegia coerulea]